MGQARTERRVDVGAVQLNVVTQGEGPPVLLLHGFPEFWYSWRHQMDALAEAGFCAIAPDLRGFNKSDKPSRVRDYKLEVMEHDLLGLLRALGHPQAHLVGHDWGGALAWTFAARHPESVQKLVVLNSAPPARMAKAFLTAAQLKRSWYMFFFQLPWLPERAVRDPAFFKRAIRGMAVHKDRFPDSELAHFEAAFAQPGAATAALNWYRAAFRDPFGNTRLTKVQAPTLIIWGERDTALGEELLEGTGDYAADFRVHRIPDASHWVQQDAPDEVSRVLLQFLAGAR